MDPSALSSGSSQSQSNHDPKSEQVDDSEWCHVIGLAFSTARTPFLLAHCLALEMTMMDVEQAITGCSECGITRCHSRWMTAYAIDISYRS